MNLFRLGPAGHEEPGILVHDLGRVDREHAAECPSVGADERVAPPITRPSKIVCVGLNYRAHALETGAKLPPEPMLFMKASTGRRGAEHRQARRRFSARPPQAPRVGEGGPATARELLQAGCSAAASLKA